MWAWIIFTFASTLFHRISGHRHRRRIGKADTHNLESTKGNAYIYGKASVDGGRQNRANKNQMN